MTKADALPVWLTRMIEEQGATVARVETDCVWLTYTFFQYGPKGGREYEATATDRVPRDVAAIREWLGY